MLSVSCDLFALDVGHSNATDLDGRLRDLRVGELPGELYNWLERNPDAHARLRCVMSHYPGTSAEIARRIVIGRDSSNTETHGVRLYFCTAGLGTPGYNIVQHPTRIPFDRIRMRNDHVRIMEQDSIRPYFFTDESGLPFAIHSAKGIIKVLGSSFAPTLNIRRVTNQPLEKQIEAALAGRSAPLVTPGGMTITDLLTRRMLQQTTLCFPHTASVKPGSNPDRTRSRNLYLLSDLSVLGGIVALPMRITDRSWHSRTKAALSQISCYDKHKEEPVPQDRNTGNLVAAALSRFCIMLAASIRLAAAETYRPATCRPAPSMGAQEGYTRPTFWPERSDAAIAPMRQLKVIASTPSGVIMYNAKPYTACSEPPIHCAQPTLPNNREEPIMWARWVAAISASSRRNVCWGSREACIARALQLGRSEPWRALTLYCSTNGQLGHTVTVGYAAADALKLKIDDIKKAVSYLSAARAIATQA